MDDSMSCWDEPRVLFFNGIFPDRYDFDVLFTNKLMAACNEQNTDTEVLEENIITLDKVPPKFICPSQWPKSTNLRCLQCTRLFKTRPLTMITHISNNGSVLTDMKTHGFMCSGDCVATYINKRTIDEKTRWQQQKMFSIFYRKLTGVSVSSFPMTHEPSELEIYGGNVSIDNHIKSLKYIVLADL